MTIKRLIGLCGRAGSGKDTVAKMIRDQIPDTVCMALADPLKEFAFMVFDFDSYALWGPSSQRNAVWPEWRHEWKWETARKKFNLYARSWTRQVADSWLSDAKLDEAMERLEGWFDGLRSEALRTTDGNHGLSARHILQTLGTEWGRAYGPDIWILFAMQRASQFLRAGSRTQVVVITDCRFVNEAKRISSLDERDFAIGEVWRLERSASGLTGAAGAHLSEQELESDEMQRWVTRAIDNDGTLEDLQRAVGLCLG